jgi:hypothetical protein
MGGCARQDLAALFAFWEEILCNTSRFRRVKYSEEEKWLASLDGVSLLMNIANPKKDPVKGDQRPTFSTERLQLAIYLHAAQRIPFLYCRAGQNGKVSFVFEDLDSSGSQAELEFDRGAEVAASDLFASQKYLRRAMSAATNRRIEKHYADTQ